MFKNTPLLLILITMNLFSQEWIQDKEQTRVSFKIKNF